MQGAGDVTSRARKNSRGALRTRARCSDAGHTEVQSTTCVANHHCRASSGVLAPRRGARAPSHHRDNAFLFGARGMPRLRNTASAAGAAAYIYTDSAARQCVVCHCLRHISQLIATRTVQRLGSQLAANTRAQDAAPVRAFAALAPATRSTGPQQCASKPGAQPASAHTARARSDSQARLQSGTPPPCRAPRFSTPAAHCLQMCNSSATAARALPALTTPLPQSQFEQYFRDALCSHASVPPACTPRKSYTPPFVLFCP